MLTPTVANRFCFFYATGNTPAINLARSVPHGQDADILSLGCGDLRYVLFTAYIQQGAGRNIILLTLILDGDNRVSDKALWDIYYHLFLDDATSKIVLDHVQKLTPLTASLQAWKAGPYAAVLQFCDEDTLHDVGRVLQRVKSAAEKRTSKEFLDQYSESLKISKDWISEDTYVFTSMRATSPLSMYSQLEIPLNFKHYWQEGTVRGTKLSTKLPNPMFAGLISEFEVLHYGTEPLAGYHLATAFADLSELSPLRPKVHSGEDKIASAAQAEFFEWVSAFRALRKKKRIVLRFVVSDVFAICHTLQHAGATGQVSANWYRRQYDCKVLRLDEEAYGPDSKAPTSFDVIETSNLSDHVGMLNIAVSAGPLLKSREWALIHTDQLTKGDNPDRKALDNLLALARIAFKMFLLMFKNEARPSDLAQVIGYTRTYGHFHSGSFVALLKLIQSKVKTLIVGTNMIQDLFVQLHLSELYTEAWITNLSKVSQEGGLFKGWREVPATVAVNVVMPRTALQRLFTLSQKHRAASPTLLGSLKSSLGANMEWSNMYADVHLVFGKATRGWDKETGDAVVNVEPDELGWSGTAPLIASFVVPTEAILLEQQSALVGLYVPISMQSLAVFGPKLGPDMMAFETTLSDSSQVILSKFRPGQKGHVMVCSGAKPLQDEIPKTNGEGPTTLRADVDTDEERITEICGHIDISSGLGRKLLREKASIELQQKDPFTIDIVFGAKKLVCPIRFPIAVSKDAARTRIARTSGYIEVIAPIADPLSSSILAPYIFPSVLTARGLPVALNMSHLNLDRLPIAGLERKEGLKWLSTLSSSQFTTREKGLRQITNRTGLAADARVNFKESLFTMFMVSSGIQGGQTGLFTISHPSRGGVHIIIVVSAIRIDGDTGSVVMDAAVIPLTVRLLESGKLEDFLIMFQEMESATIRVDDEELALWKKVLPAMAERCRTWPHLSQCEYKQSAATVPLSLEHGEKVLCSCGNGKLPDDFVAIPVWEEASKCATRIAISPTFAVPFVEEVINVGEFDKRGVAGLAPVPRCRKCGKKDGGGELSLKRCNRCKTTKYCSVECQKEDWKKHKQECQAAKQ
ncbi:N-lysine methyltransferase SMYD2 [Escovopsis weberi]|uniref:N-lysine methyltransferase SMYD2 n=1 Tax=Escovopsis weberi TaxID=150374 RepID=A0A0N0RSZ6_ESCWE|nr:N-lysine methyltransferase SMYD2 [Escovopsis weberi]